MLLPRREAVPGARPAPTDWRSCLADQAASARPSGCWLVGMRGLVLTAAVGMAALLAPGAFAATLRVPQDAATIQAAIAAASDGDTVLVAPGTYLGPIDFGGKSIVLASTGGAALTTIDGGGVTPVVAMTAPAGATPTLDGFTVTGGAGSSMFDGAVYTSGGPALIENNVITRNGSCDGSGVAAHFSAATISHNQIVSNAQVGCTGGADGGGVSIIGAGTVRVIHNVIRLNSTTASGGGVSIFAGGLPVLDGNLIADNSAGQAGGGIALANVSDALITNNVVVGNSAPAGGALWWLVPSGARGPFAIGNTIGVNKAPNGSAIFASGFDASAEIVDNVVEGAGATVVVCDSTYSAAPPFLQSNDVVATGPSPLFGGSCAGALGQAGNVSVAPGFVDEPNRDFHLAFGSALIDAGTNAGASPTDFDGVARPLDGNRDGVAVADIGAFEFVPDVTPPVVTVPAAIVVPAATAAGRTVAFSVSASDPDDAATTAVCVPASGSVFPIGVTTVTCTSSDTHGNVGAGSIMVTVEPVANADFYTTVSGSKLVVAAPGLLGNDVVDALASVSSVAPPAGGVLAVAPNGSFSYQPAAGFVGTVFFSYRVASDGASSGPAQVTVSVPAPGAVCNLAAYPRPRGVLSLKNGNLAGCYLAGASLAGANASGATFHDAYLAGASLAGANLSNADLSGAVMTGANVAGVTWNRTICPDGTSSSRDGGTCAGHLG